MDMLKNAVSSVSNAVSNAVGDVKFAAAQKWTEIEIKKYTGKDIEVVIEWDDGMSQADKDRWEDWLIKTGCNSLCVDDTWDFLEKSEWNKVKVDKWNERNINKIIMKPWTDPDPDLDTWASAEVEWNTGDRHFTIWWLPHALSWSSANTWHESGSHCWWILRDEIVFGLQLYQLPGKCFYKSDWLDNFEDPDPDSLSPWGTKKFSRWFQFRHWVIMWYAEAQWGWNYQWTTTPPKNPDGSLFNLDNILKLPSMPSLKMPSIKLPSLPNISLPTLPSLSMPSVSMPSLSMPSLSAPDLSNISMPSIPDKPKRPSNKWACHGLIEMSGLKVKAKGKTLVLSDATITHFWEEKNGNIKDERKEHQRLELGVTSEEQATSWQLSLIEGGAEEGEVGGCCCNIA